MRPESTLIRVRDKFKHEIEEIQEQREELGLSKLSYSKITSLMLRHRMWSLVKSDLINYTGYDDE